MRVSWVVDEQKDVFGHQQQVEVEEKEELQIVKSNVLRVGAVESPHLSSVM